MTTKTKRGWVTILFTQGEEAEPFLTIIEEKGERACIREMAEWDFGGESEHCMSITAEPAWGTSDYVCRALGYVLSYNTRLGYVSLSRKQSEPKG